MLISMGSRSNLFFCAGESRDYGVETNFKGLGFLDTQQDPPDTMAAVGSNHCVELLNCFSRQPTNSSVVLFDKVGTSLMQTNGAAFFALPSGPTDRPMVDGRILYDSQAHAWVASGLDSGSNQVVMAICTNQNPAFTNWFKYLLPVARAGFRSDRPNLGLDGNGIYVSLVHFAGNTNAGHTVVAVKKPEIYNGTLLLTITNIAADPPVWTIQPAVNFDPVASTNYAWFVVKGPPQLGPPYQGGAVLYRRLQWSNTVALWVDTSWRTNADTSYRDYYDLDGTNAAAVRAPETGVSAPQAGGPKRIDLHLGGSELLMAMIRNGYLWTCHHVGLVGTNGNFTGAQNWTNVDRSGVQWLKLSVAGDGSPLTLGSCGRIWDSSAVADPMWYYFPSLMVNCAGDMVTGFSGSSTATNISAYYGWLPANSGPAVQVRLLHAGVDYYDASRWGDYSATCLDPTDDRTFWTVQEYADHPLPNPPMLSAWGTWIAKIRSVPEPDR